MSNHTAFMYSESGDAILVTSERAPDPPEKGKFDLRNGLHCPVCRFEIVGRTSNPLQDKAVFLEGMKYIADGREYEVVVEILNPAPER